MRIFRWIIAFMTVSLAAPSGMQVFAATSEEFWTAFCDAIGRPDLAARHATDAGDQRDLLAAMRQVFRSRTRDEWLTLLAGHEVCATPVNTPDGALRDPHALARGTVRVAAGFRTIRPPFLATAVDLAPAPAVGQHTAEILDSLSR